MSLSHVTAEQIQAGLPDLYLSPKDSGPVRLIVCRPSTGARVLLDEAELDPAIGLRGDSWQIRGSSRTEDGSANPDAQLTMMNSRVIALLAGDQENWGSAGDQLFVDLELSQKNLPAGTRLLLGTAVIEVTAEPHLGVENFGAGSERKL